VQIYSSELETINSMPTLNGIYWENRYQKGDTGWDMGSASTPLLDYCSQLNNKDLKILIPGCGNGHEAFAMAALGFTNITLLDVAPSPLDQFKEKNSPLVNAGIVSLLCEDFFDHQNTYDLILEQTFFCAIHPAERDQYAKTMFNLLKPQGKLAGLLFNFQLTEEGPPFGGDTEGYVRHFEPYFQIHTLEPCFNSIKPRKGRELFFILQKPA
jgi:SAM-dependent methyltransferase